MADEERVCKCPDGPGCQHHSVPEQRLAEAIFGTREPVDQDRPCYHPEFEAIVSVGRIGEGDDDNPCPGMPRHFMAEIRVTCAACGERFLFEGVPAGMSFAAPAVSVDGAELRAPMRPESAPPSFPRSRPGPSGFFVDMRDPRPPGDPRG